MNGVRVRERRLQLGLSQAKLSELSDVPQHLISAYELHNADLTHDLLQKVYSSLADSDAVASVINRAKRYQIHRYKEVHKLQSRIDKASQTVGNEPYKRLLKQIWSLHTEGGAKPLSALSLFSGIGGLSLGFSAAGFDVKGFVEANADLRSLYRSNFPTSQMVGSDVTLLSDNQILALRASVGPFDVLIGGPPCQGFSLAGKRSVTDPRNNLFTHYARIMNLLQPKVALLENVRLLTSMRSEAGKLIRDDIQHSFERSGYSVRHFELNAKSYGVPQHRERVVFVAIRKDLGLPPTLPAPIFSAIHGLFDSERTYRTFADACSDLPFIESGQTSNDRLHSAVNHPAHVIQWLWDVPEGCSAHDNALPNDRPPSGYNTTYKRQVWNEPGATVQTTFGMISGCRNVHPIATRSLTVREAARLQSFPDEFKLEGALGTVRTGIGNAVPPLLSYELGLHIKHQLLSL